MTDTPTLDIPHVPAAATNKYLYINAGFDQLDNAANAKLDVDCTAGGSIAVSATSIKNYGVFKLTGAPGAGFNLNLGAVNRPVLIWNVSGQTATIRAGTFATTQALPNGDAGLFMIQTNDVVALAGAGASYTDEQAQDAIAAALTAGTQVGIVVTYDDVANSFSFEVEGNSDYQESVEIISTTNITLNDEQTLQGIALVDGDRVGAFGQTFAPDRRIWIVRAGADWDIAPGWDVADTITTNAQVTADQGTYEGQTYRLSTTGTIVLGTTSLTWVASATSVAQYVNRNVNSAAYTILSTDRNKWIYLGRSGNQAITLEEYAVQPMAIGSQFVLQMYAGSGTKTITADGAVTLNGSAGGSVVLDVAYDAYVFKQKAKNIWVALPQKNPTGITQEQSEDYAAALFAAGTHSSGVTFTYTDGTPKLELTLNTSTLIDSIGSTRGQVLYRGAAAWSALAVGTAGQVLQSGGAGADPSWLTLGAALTQENVEDYAAGMITGATHTNISVSYNDGSGLLAFSLPTALTGGHTLTSYAINGGSAVTTGTTTPDPADGNMQHMTNGGASTFAAPTAAGEYQMQVEVTNNGSAGTLTISGFTYQNGDTLTTTNGHKFLLNISKTKNYKLLTVVKLQ